MSQAVNVQPQHHADQRYALTELGALAFEIQVVEGLDFDAALDRAAEQLDLFVRYYPLDWDGSTVHAGTGEACADGMPF